MKFQVRLILRRAKRFSKGQKNGYKIRQTLFGLLGAMFLLPSVTGCVGAVDQASELDNAISTAAVVKIKRGKEKIRPDREYLVSWKINNAQLFYRYNLIESFSPRAPGAQAYTKEYPIMRTGPNSSFSGSKSFGKTEIGVYTYSISQCKVSFDLKPDPNIISSCLPLGLCFPGSECTSQDSIEITNKLPPDNPGLGVRESGKFVGTRIFTTGDQVQIDLSWNNSVGSNQFELWEKAPGQDWSKLATTSATSYPTIMINADFSADEDGKKANSLKEYSYRVRSFNEWGYSGFSTRNITIYFNMVEYGSCKNLCFTPPQAKCNAEGSIVKHNTFGVCYSGTCYYEQPKTYSCFGNKKCKIQQCLDDSKPCTNDEIAKCVEYCNGEFCDSPPSSYCVVDASVRFKHEGFCYSNSGGIDGVVDTGRSETEERCVYNKEYWHCEDCNDSLGKCYETPEPQNIVKPPCARNSDCGRWGKCKKLTASECNGLPFCEERTKCEYKGATEDNPAVVFKDDPVFEDMLYNALHIDNKAITRNHLKRIAAVSVVNTEAVKFTSILKLSNATLVFWGNKNLPGYKEGFVYNGQFISGTVIDDRFYNGVFRKDGSFLHGFIRQSRDGIKFFPGLYSQGEIVYGKVLTNSSGKPCRLIPYYLFDIQNSSDMDFLKQVSQSGGMLYAKISMSSGYILADVLFQGGRFHHTWNSTTIDHIVNESGIPIHGWKEMKEQLRTFRPANISLREDSLLDFVLDGGEHGDFGNGVSWSADCADGYNGLTDTWVGGGILLLAGVASGGTAAAVLGFADLGVNEQYQHVSECTIEYKNDELRIRVGRNEDVKEVKIAPDGTTKILLHNGEWWVIADPSGTIFDRTKCETLTLKSNLGGLGTALRPYGLFACKEKTNDQQDEPHDRPDDLCYNMNCVPPIDCPPGKKCYKEETFQTINPGQSSSKCNGGQLCMFQRVKWTCDELYLDGNGNYSDSCIKSLVGDSWVDCC